MLNLSESLYYGSQKVEYYNVQNGGFGLDFFGFVFFLDVFFQEIDLVFLGLLFFLVLWG